VTIRPPKILLALACLAAAGAAGCGNDEEESRPLPRSAVGQLERQLTSIENRIEFARDASPAEAVGACDDIDEDNVPSVDRIVAGIPEDVDADVRDALQRSFDRLFELARSQCDELRERETTTEETTPTETTPPPTIPETTPTETQETETQEERPERRRGPRKPRRNDGGGGQAPGQDGGGGAPVPEDD
jgi:hypothetical protein